LAQLDCGRVLHFLSGRCSYNTKENEETEFVPSSTLGREGGHPKPKLPMSVSQNPDIGKDEGQGENTQDAAHTDLSFSSLFAPTPRDIRGA